MRIEVADALGAKTPFNVSVANNVSPAILKLCVCLVQSRRTLRGSFAEFSEGQRNRSRKFDPKFGCLKFCKNSTHKEPGYEQFSL